MRLYHSTHPTVAEYILANGFEDRSELEGWRQAPATSGTFFFVDRPLEGGSYVGDTVTPNVVIAVDVPDELARKYQVHEKYDADDVLAEFLIPASIINNYPRERVES